MMHEKKYLVLFAGLLFLIGSTPAAAQSSEINSRFNVGSMGGHGNLTLHGTSSDGLLFVSDETNGNNTAGVPVTDDGAYRASFEGQFSGLAVEDANLVDLGTVDGQSPQGSDPTVVFPLGPGTTVTATVSPVTLAAAMSPFTYPDFVSALQAGSLGLSVSGPGIGTAGEVGSVVIAIPPATAKFYLAQFGNGGGLKSDITIINTSTTTNVQGNVFFYDPGGDPLSVGIQVDEAPAGVQEETDVPFDVARYEKDVISTDGMGDLIQGSIGVEALGVDNSGDPRLPSIGVSVRFTVTGLGIAAFAPGQIFGDSTNGASSPVIVSDTLTTGTAARNVSDREITLRCRLFDSDGNGVDNGDVDVVLPVNGRSSRQLGALFPQVDFSGGFSGTLRYTTRGGGDFVTLTLENGINPGEFTVVTSVGRQRPNN